MSSAENIKNWNDLPEKLKHRCVGKMDFITRFRLRSTSKSNRRLVNLHKFQFKSVKIKEKDGFPFGLLVFIPATCSEGEAITVNCANIEFNHNAIIPLMKYVMRAGKVEQLEVNINGSSKEKQLIDQIVRDIFNLPSENESKEKNWKDLSDKLKLEVIKRMDFKSRIRFRKVSYEERSLVDSQYIHFEFVHLTGNSMAYFSLCSEFSFRVTNQEYTFKFRTVDEFKLQCLPLLRYILKIGEIDRFVAQFASKYVYEIMKDLSDWDFPKFRIENLDTSVSRKGMFFFVRKCDENVLKSIRINAENYRNFPIENLLTFPVIFNAHKIEIDYPFDLMFACPIIEKWLEIDAEIGTSLIVHYWIDIAYELIDNFKNRIIYQSTDKTEVLMTTRNEGKHIHIKPELDEKNEYIEQRQFIRIQIIPAENVALRFKKLKMTHLKESIYNG